MTPFLVQTTTDTKSEAKKIADILIKKKLTACIQISAIDSIYEWKNQICKEKEYLLNIKTKKKNYKKIEREIKENHSYDVPEIIGTKIVSLSKDYKKFMKEGMQ